MSQTSHFRSIGLVNGEYWPGMATAFVPTLGLCAYRMSGRFVFTSTTLPVVYNPPRLVRATIVKVPSNVRKHLRNSASGLASSNYLRACARSGARVIH